MLIDITDDMQIKRPQRVEGIITTPDGYEFEYASGSPTNTSHPSCPLGSSYFSFPQYAPKVPGKLGYLLVGSANGFDPKVNRNRSQIMIHRGRTNDPYRLASWGCPAIAANQFDSFRASIDPFVAVLQQLWCNVHPNGDITITVDPEYNQDGSVK